MTFPPWIHEQFTATSLPPRAMDLLWAAGWRRFGTTLFRYSLAPADPDGLDVIVPLRIDIGGFTPTRAQLRVLRKNVDVAWEFRPAALSGEVCELFDLHRQRFKSNVPESLALFLGEDPAGAPCECLELRCLVNGRLIAASFMDVGAFSVSSVYAVFDPDESLRSPGILTMLKEIEWARLRGMRHHHPGYATLGAGIYEYKKRFRPLEGYDWKTCQWLPWEVLRSR